MPVLLFELVNRLEVSVQVVPAVVPGIARVVDIRICPFIGEVYFSGVGFEVRKRVENVAAQTVRFDKDTDMLCEYAREIVCRDK